ncbi:MAG: sigma 54-interacting transcriptional regulator [Planctomycetes bacterium]|nr:sigma 54-interacting transcriptional regulator [Planctomycetota bacterium]
MNWTEHTHDLHEKEEALPAGYASVAELSRRPDGSRVVRARRGDREVVLRIAPDAVGVERAAELAVLARVEHPSIARLVDWGSLDGGASWVAREWIDGSELGRWAVGRSQVEVGRVLAELGFALAHLHAAGFVHADLKAANVLVRPDGRPVVTDFGLSLARGERREGATGSWLAIAPELLAGGAPDAASDLFAFGVMIVGLFADVAVTPRDFYARFPAEDFLAAAGLTSQALPEWSRDLVARLVARDPSERPASAAWAARGIVARLGLELEAPRLAEAPRLPLFFGREDLVRTIADAQGDVWLECSSGEDVALVARELALTIALAGGRVERVDLTAELATIRDSVALDAWAQQRARGADERRRVVSVPSDGVFELRALEALVRATRQAHGRSQFLAVIAPGNVLPSTDLGGLRLAFPRVAEETWADFVAAEFPEETQAQRAELAAWLAQASDGSTVDARRGLARAAAVGAIAVGVDGYRVRPSALPTDLGEHGKRVELSPEARRLAAAFHVLGERASARDLATIAAVSDANSARAIDELLASGVARRRGAELEREFDGLAPLEELVPADERREFAARASSWLAERGAPAHVAALFEWLAGRRSLDELIAETRTLREGGLHELALRLASRARRLAVDARARRELDFETAHGWLGLGELERAARVAEELGRDDDSESRALALRVRASIALQRHDARAALELAVAAGAADPAQAADAACLETRSLYDLRRDDVVVERAVASLARNPNAATRAQLVEVQAMALARLGDVDHAVQLLTDELAHADRAGHGQRAAALSLNLATLARRRGRPDEARRAYERALNGYQTAGFLPGIAQARAQWGAFLRETGELAAGEPLLASALELRERLGDRTGAVAVRGMLGLLYAERGRMRAALDELQRAAAELFAAKKSVEALLLGARADECAARIGALAERSVNRSDAANLAEGDPRTLTAVGRARWLRGDVDGARDAFERAERLARSVGLAIVADEAWVLLERLAGRPIAEERVRALANELVRDDEELLAVLASPNLDRPEVHRRLQALEARGRDDRAARLACALAARTRDPRAAASHRARFEALFARCAAGLDVDEARALRGSLLSMPDPFPEDLAAGEQRAATDEEFEMEVVSLLDINRQLLEQEELPRLIGTIVEKTLEVSGAQRGFLILEEDGELAFDTARDSRRGDIRDPELEVSRSVLAEALSTMRPLRVSNAAEEPGFAAAPSVIALDLRSILCLPFRVDAKLRGVIYVDHRLVEGAFSARTERMLSLLADQAGLAILQVRRLDEIRRLNRELRRQVATQDVELVRARRALESAGVTAPKQDLVGSSTVMRGVQRLIERAAQVKLPVLVTGESGTGKELAALALHSLSPRKDAPFVSENCAALPPTLIEAELFGACRGAFTGADRDREGLIERAHGGTLFLDEIGELPLELQAKLLRVLETSEIRRLGDNHARLVDFRLVAATNRDLEREVREGRFRSDLYYRLDGLQVRMPPLSERESDIPELVAHFLRMQTAQTGRARAIAPAVVERLVRRAWPGNVRELFNELARLAVMSEGDIVDPSLVRDPGNTKGSAPRADGSQVRSLAELEREAIFHAIEACGGDKRKAAELLGISRAKIYQRLKDWGVTGANADDGEGAA